MKNTIILYFLVIVSLIMGGIGGSILFDFSYPPYNFEAGMIIGGVVAFLYITKVLLKGVK